MEWEQLRVMQWTATRKYEGHTSSGFERQQPGNWRGYCYSRQPLQSSGKRALNGTIQHGQTCSCHKGSEDAADETEKSTGSAWESTR